MRSILFGPIEPLRFGIPLECVPDCAVGGEELDGLALARELHRIDILGVVREDTVQFSALEKREGVVAVRADRHECLVRRVVLEEYPEILHAHI